MNFLGKQVKSSNCFCGIAIIWIFSITKGDSFILHPSLHLFVLGLAFDLIQYVWSSTTWGIFHRIKEKKHSEEDEIRHPFSIVIPIYIFYYAKISFVIAAYIHLFKFVTF